MMYIKRERYLSKIRPFYYSDLIKVLTGVRRCGKSVLLGQIEEELKKEKKSPKKQRNPEPKISTDFSELIKELDEIKSQGNELFKKRK